MNIEMEMYTPKWVVQIAPTILGRGDLILQEIIPRITEFRSEGVGVTNQGLHTFILDLATLTINDKT